MKNRNLWNGLLGLTVVILIAAGLFLFIRWVVEKVSTLESQTSAAVIVGSVTILVAVMGHAVQVFITRQREREEARREAKTELYEAFMVHWFKVMQIGKQSGTQGQSGRIDTKTLGTQNEITQRMILWGSDSVIVAYGDLWRAVLNQQGVKNPHEMLARFEDVMFAMREDLGHKNKGLDRRDLLSLFITDADSQEFDKFPRSRNRKSQHVE